MKFLRSVAIGFLFGFFVLSVQAESSGSNILLGGVEKSAEEGDANAQFGLGVLYLNGDGVRQDYVKAREWFEQAAAQGNAYAQVSLGGLYHKGQGVRQDYVKAREWYEQAAAQGHALSYVALGTLYFNGDGVRQSRHQAVEYYGKGCDLGEQLGCDLYRKHKGTTTAK